MADDYQIDWEYTNGNSIVFKTEDLTIKWERLYMEVQTRPDGNIYVVDPGKVKRTFSFTSVLTGATLNTLNTVYTAAITYDATYPRIKTIYLAGATTLTNIECAMTSLTADDLGSGMWNVSVVLEEYTTA